VSPAGTQVTGAPAVDSLHSRIDGRRAKGQRRRRALLEATLQVVERDGVAGVSHRSVTRQAGLPSSAATYYFDSIDSLLEAALLWAEEANTEPLRAIAAAPDPPAALARWLVEDCITHRDRVIAEYELFLLAARRPALARAATRWIEELSALVSGWTDDPGSVRAVCAYVDGLLLQALVTHEVPEAAELEAIIRRLC
jgi:TetR/AcrR family transcriptional regulator, regulator of biofilm formation and stress response